VAVTINDFQLRFHWASSVNNALSCGLAAFVEAYTNLLD